MSLSKIIKDIMLNKVNGKSIDDLIKVELVEELKSLSAIKSIDDLYIYGSTGAGNQSFVPWVAIMNEKITKTVQESIYLVFLFAQNGQKVSLSLNQGVRNLKKLHEKIDNKSMNKYEFIEATSNVLLDKLDDHKGYITGILNLVDNQKKESGGLGYQFSNIMSKEYFVNNLPANKEIEEDLEDLLEKYYQLQNKIGDYDEFILGNSYKARQYLGNKKEKEKMKKSELIKTKPEDIVILDSLDTFNQVSKASGNGKGQKKPQKPISDEDLKKQLTEQANIGDLAEIEVLDYYQKMVNEKFGEEMAKKVERVSEKKGHGLGYDIKAFDLESGEEIFIEVKGTKSTKPNYPFFMSINELVKLIGNQKFKIVRVFGVGSGSSEFMFYDGFEKYSSLDELLKEKFIAEPISFRIKGVKLD